LSCSQHEYLWRSAPPTFLSELVGRGRLHVACLRLQHVPLGHVPGRPANTLPSALEKLADMVEQVDGGDMFVQCWLK
jgi:hypothetical protein